MFARTARYDGLVDPETLEMLACRDAILAAVEKGIRKVVIETDCSNIKNLWESMKGERTASFYILCEMRSLVISFQGFELLYPSRSLNRAAHLTAKEALHSNTIINHDVVPGFLIAILQSEKLQPVE